MRQPPPKHPTAWGLVLPSVFLICLAAWFALAWSLTA